MSNTIIRELFKKYLEDDITPEEFTQLYGLISEGYDPAILDGLLEGAFVDPRLAVIGEDHERQAVFNALLEEMDKKSAVTPGRVFRFPARRRFVAAATVAILLLGGLGMYWKIHSHESGRLAVQAAVTLKKAVGIDAPPGRSGAVLTLADGKQIELDSTRNGALAAQGNTRLLKQGSSLRYQQDTASSHEVMYNTMTTARGKQYQLQLADGTMVWLNAGSSIRFPTAFKGKERRVEVTGEVYFEVARNKEMPFVVQVNQSEVQVLGTRFNVMSYDDEQVMSTTLVEGAVRIVNGAGRLILTPGEQGRVSRESGKLSSSPVDVEQAIAWTKGRLSLVNVDFAMLMRQISRWYDVDIRFERNVPNIHIGGFINRDVNLATVLEFLQENGMHYRTEGKTIVIMP